MYKKGQLDEVSIPGILFAVIAGGIGIIVSKQMGSGVVMRLISALVCAVVAYFVGSKVSES